MNTTTDAVTADAMTSNVKSPASASNKPYKAPKAEIDWKVLASVASLVIAVATFSGSVVLFQYLATFCVDPGWVTCSQTLPMSMVVLGTAAFFVTGMVLGASMAAQSKAHSKLDQLLASVSVA